MRRAVHVVALHRRPARGEMQADLVGAAGVRLGFDQGRVAPGLQHLEIGLRLLACGRIDAMAAGFAFFRPEHVGARPLGLLGQAVGHGEVGLLDHAVGEEARDGRHRAEMFHAEQDPAGAGIEAVDVPEIPHVPRTRPVVARADRRLDRQRQVAHGVLPVVRSEDPAGRLVEGHDRAVFVEDRDARLVRELDVGRFRHALMKARFRDEGHELRGGVRPGTADFPVRHFPSATQAGSPPS